MGKGTDSNGKVAVATNVLSLADKSISSNEWRLSTAIKVMVKLCERFSGAVSFTRRSGAVFCLVASLSWHISSTSNTDKLAML